MADGFDIRPAVTPDLAEIPKIELAAATLFSEADLPQNLRHKVTAAAELRSAKRNGRLWVAVVDARITGFAMANIVDGQAYLDELDVLPEFGRRGIGKRLVGEVVRWARQHRFATLSLVTFRHLRWNAPFYEKLGFMRLAAAEHGPELAGLIAEEAHAGIDRRKRVAMRLEL